MDKRTFFFLRDNVTKKFYTGEGNYLSVFYDAAVYHNELNAKKGLKRVVQSWAFDEKNMEYWIEKSSVKRYENQPDKEWQQDKEFAANGKRQVLARKDLKDWGIEIVSVEVAIS